MFILDNDEKWWNMIYLSYTKHVKIHGFCKSYASNDCIKDQKDIVIVYNQISLLPSHGHQKPWHWPCRITGSLYSPGENCNYQCHLREEVIQNANILLYLIIEIARLNWHILWCPFIRADNSSHVTQTWTRPRCHSYIMYISLYRTYFI